MNSIEKFIDIKLGHRLKYGTLRDMTSNYIIYFDIV